MKPKISIVVPVKEEPSLHLTLYRLEEAINQYPHEVVLVVDSPEEKASLDRLPKEKEFVSERVVVSHGSGPAQAISTGLREATGEYAIVFMGDGSDDPYTIPAMVELAEKEGLGMVCASRYSFGGDRIGGPWMGAFLSKWAGWTLRKFGGVPTLDSTNAFKLYRLSMAPSGTVESEKFEVSLELLYKFLLAGRSIGEVPTVWRDRTAGKSKFRLWGWIPKYLRWYFRLMFWKLR